VAANSSYGFNSGELFANELQAAFLLVYYNIC
jgi:hypothetical protein